MDHSVTCSFLNQSEYLNIYVTLSHLADAFIRSDLQMRKIEAIKTNNRATTCNCYNKSRLAYRSTCSKVFFFKKQVDRLEKKDLVLVFQ